MTEKEIALSYTCEDALNKCNGFATKCAEANKDFQEALANESNKLSEARAKYAQLRYSLWRYRALDKLERIVSAITVIAAPKTEEGTSFLDKLWLFAKTMWAWARSGFKMSDEQTQQARLEICHACPHLIKDKVQCSMCGCMMKKKVTLDGASCPLKKW